MEYWRRGGGVGHLVFVSKDYTYPYRCCAFGIFTLANNTLLIIPHLSTQRFYRSLWHFGFVEVGTHVNLSARVQEGRGLMDRMMETNSFVRLLVVALPQNRQ